MISALSGASLRGSISYSIEAQGSIEESEIQPAAKAASLCLNQRTVELEPCSIPMVPRGALMEEELGPSAVEKYEKLMEEVGLKAEKVRPVVFVTVEDQDGNFIHEKL